MDNQEILLKDNPNRFVLFPIKYPKIWKAYQDEVKTFWTPEEIPLADDINDWNNLKADEQHFIKNILAFFAASDGIVLENLGQRFITEVQIPEIRCFYGFQMMMENIHSHTYSLLIDTYIKDTEEKSKLFNAVQEVDSIKQKANWAIKWIEDDKSSFALRLIAFAVVEGIFFSGSFCSIYWLKERSLMPGLTFSNELISRDEGLHTDFACLLYSMINNKIPEETVHELIEEAVLIEKNFIIDSLPCNLIGMNSKLMSQYIECVADRLLVQLGYSKIYNTQNPFGFMEMMSIDGKTNFFEKKVAEYRIAGVGATEEEKNFSLTDSF